MTESSRLMAKAAVLGILARGFAYPDRAVQESLARGTYRDEVLAALHQMGAGPEDRVSQLRDALQEAGADPARLEQEHTYLFHRNVPASPNETSYEVEQTFQRVQELSAIASLYAAFGFQVARGKGELPDHIGAELEFLAVLYAKEAYALEQGRPEQAEVCAHARARFLAEHVGRWVPAFAQKLQEEARAPFYPALAAMADAVLSGEPAYLAASLPA